ncbi:MAG TPA: NADH-quinone oxidoreductase subunit N, partial [Actinomycetota bacterium]|nr:NADH-quinone oxidoreductase subunit N [Actinomycetota bacterium]
MDIDLVALLPEIILATVACAVMTIDLFLEPEKRRIAFPLSVLGILATLAAVLNLFGDNISTLNGMFVVDRFAVVFKLVFCVAALLVFAVSEAFIEDDRTVPHGEYYTMMLFSLLGMLTIASSRDLIAIFVALEMISLPAFILAGIRKHDIRSNEAALKFFLFGVLSTALMLFGMSLFYGITGATNLADVADGLSGRSGIEDISLLAILFLIVGFGFKVSAFPFQWWVPDTYEGAPVPVAAFLSVASKTAGFVGLFQVMFLALGPLADIWRPIFGVIGVITMTFGNLVALQQKQIVRLLAYSSIAQAGYMMIPLGVASATSESLNTQIVFAAVVYLLIYAFMETGAFACATAFARRGGSYRIDDYSGMFARAPGLSVAMAIFLLSLAGVLPFAGFWAKFMVFRVLIDGNGLWLAIAMAVNTVISLFFYAAVVKRMFMDQTESTAEVTLPTPLSAAIGVAAVVVLVGGLAPAFFTD